MITDSCIYNANNDLLFMNDLLQELTEFEKNKVNRIIPVDGSLTIDYILPRNLPLTHRDLLQVKIILSISGIKIQARMDRIFIHQLGKRIYGDSFGNEYFPIFYKWLSDFNERNSSFQKKIIDIIISNELIIKYYNSFDKYIFYGFVSPKFSDTNQIIFRDVFHKCAQKTYKIDTSSYSQHKLKDKLTPIVKEYYKFNTGNTYVSLSCGIVYGINNGYGAYSTHWVRKLNQNDIWLAPWKSKIEFKWRNNPRFHDDSAMEEMQRFVEFTGLSHKKRQVTACHIFVVTKLQNDDDCDLPFQSYTIF